MRNFNRNIRKRFIPQPLTVDEITSIFGEVFSFAIQSRLPLLSVNKKFAFLSLILKFWKIRHRIIATFAQKFLKSAY
jgi:hypothetical protein